MSALPEIVILQGAQADLLGIYSRFGEHTESRIGQAFEGLILQPQKEPAFEGDLRRLVVPGSPFGNFYFAYSKRIVITAVLDLGQNPEWIRKRLERD